jgi:hypothetical protein
MLKNRRKKNNGHIHINLTVPSSPDTVSLGEAVEERFLNLCSDWYRIKHVELEVPKDLDKDFFLWRTMRVRHKQVDYRNTSDEVLSTRRIADWLLQKKCELVGKLYVPLEWPPLT